MRRDNVRNIAIIAHVDHGKTTLVDCLLRQSGTVESHKGLQERARTSSILSVSEDHDFEQEYGVEVKESTSTLWIRLGTRLGGEVERVLAWLTAYCLS